MNGHQKLLTERELAELLSLSPDTLRRMRRAGEIPYVAISRRRIGYRPEEIERWLQERSVREVSRESEEGVQERADEIMAAVLRAV